MFAYWDVAMQIIDFHTAVSDFILKLQQFPCQDNFRLTPWKWKKKSSISATSFALCATMFVYLFITYLLLFIFVNVGVTDLTIPI